MFERRGCGDDAAITGLGLLTPRPQRSEREGIILKFDCLIGRGGSLLGPACERLGPLEPAPVYPGHSLRDWERRSAFAGGFKGQPGLAGENVVWE